MQRSYPGQIDQLWCDNSDSCVKSIVYEPFDFGLLNKRLRWTLINVRPGVCLGSRRPCSGELKGVLSHNGLVTQWSYHTMASENKVIHYQTGKIKCQCSIEAILSNNNYILSADTVTYGHPAMSNFMFRPTEEIVQPHTEDTN